MHGTLAGQIGGGATSHSDMDDECQWDGCCEGKRAGAAYFYAACLDCEFRWQVWGDLDRLEGIAEFHEARQRHIVHVFYPN